MALTQLVDYVNELLRAPQIEDFCPNGLQVEGAHEKITKIATGVSASLKTIEAAIEEKAQVLLVHHGLFWNKEPLSIAGSMRAKIKALLDHRISLLAYHLPLDCHEEFGNNWVAAKELGWKNLEPFGPTQGPFTLGVRGEFSPMSVQEFAETLEKFYNHKAHKALGGSKEVKSAALISGGAHREIRKAIESGVDCFITGSFDEPIWNIAYEEKINFFAMGHANTEEIGPRALGAHLAKRFKLEHAALEIPNPF